VPAGERLDAGEVVERGAVAGVRGEALADQRLGALPVAGFVMRHRAEAPLPRRHLVALAPLATDREHGGAGLLGDRVPLRRRVGQEHERAGGRVELLAVEHEAGVAADHDVELLVAEPLLGVPLDHVLARRHGGIGVDAERLHAEQVAQRQPAQAGGMDGLDLGEAGGAEGHPARLSLDPPIHDDEASTNDRWIQT